MATSDEKSPGLEDLNTPIDELEGAVAEEISDPTAQSDEAEEPSKKKRRKKKRRKKEPKAKHVASSEEVTSSKESGSSMIDGLAKASPYTVMLAISLAAILFAILLLVIDFHGYEFDYKAKAAKQGAAAPAAFPLSELSRTEVA